MKMLKRILAILLAISIFSATVFATAAETEEKTESNGSQIPDLMNAHKVNPLTGKEIEPFNDGSGYPVLMNKENELHGFRKE